MSMWFTLNVKNEAALPFKPAHQTRIKAAEATQSTPPGSPPPPTPVWLPTSWTISVLRE